MRDAVHPADLSPLGVPADEARALADRVTTLLRAHAADRVRPEGQVRLWQALQQVLLERGPQYFAFPVHHFLYALAYEGRRREDGPGPAWVSDPAGARRTNLGRFLEGLKLPDYRALHRFSVEHREEFWRLVLDKTRIKFRRRPERVLPAQSDVTRPEWLPGAEFNLVDSCFHGDPRKTAIVYGREGTSERRTLSYLDLERWVNRVAHGLDRLGLPRDARVALYMPMTPEAVAVYLGVIRSGRAVVGIADTSAPAELDRRVRLGAAQLVFTIDAYVRDGKELRIYDKVVEAKAPRAVVVSADGADAVRTPLRAGDVAWDAFLPGADAYESVARRPNDLTNVLFSSGTTKDPKAIPWTQTTPFKCVMDAYFHHDVQPADVLAWPTSYGWMMGPWLTYAALVHGATMALFNGAPTRREFGQFVADAEVTMLGVVPKLVRAWRLNQAMEGLDWSRIHRFSSTAEPSDPDDMLYLMHLAAYKPVIEYCGGTEIGGGYITGTLVQPAAPATFTTASLGLDFYVLDEQGRPTGRGEVALVPPSIGLSNELLNYDHHQEYFAGFPRGPKGEVLRRHGDQLERLGGGYWRHHGRMDDMINLNGVKTSSEEVRHVIQHPLVADAKPIAVDREDKGQHSLVVYAVPHDKSQLDSAELRERLRNDFAASIRAKLNPLLAHVHDVVLVAELPQAGPGKTRTMKELQKDYRSRGSLARPR